MENGLQKKFGLWTAVSMVVGIVIGSGVFFKAVNVLKYTGGSMSQSLLVIAIVGLICIICSCVFATLGTKYVRCNGIIDYAEVACGSRFAYYMGWFMTTIYYPCLSATLAFVSARYTSVLLGYDDFGFFTIGCGALYLMMGIAINALAPKLAGRMQVSMMVIKLIPLCVMAVVGVIVGLVNGNGIAIFSDTSGAAAAGSSGGVLAGVCAFAFAYEGWIIATTINSELRNPKKDLPRALIGGALFCTVIYMLYVYSMSATMSASEILAAGNNLPRVAFSNMFGPAVGTIAMVFIIISCLGTMNGLIMGCMRGMYSVAVRGQGPKPTIVSTVDKDVDMPLKSCFIGLALCAFWYFQCAILFFNGPLVTGATGNPNWFFGWEADEIVIITQYALYIPIFLYLVFKEKEFNFFQRFVLPILGVIACVFMCYCCVLSYGSMVYSYLVVFAIFMLVGYLIDKKNKVSKKKA